jgi:hypothetical protein
MRIIRALTGLAVAACLIVIPASAAHAQSYVPREVTLTISRSALLVGEDATLHGLRYVPLSVITVTVSFQSGGGPLRQATIVPNQPVADQAGNWSAVLHAFVAGTLVITATDDEGNSATLVVRILTAGLPRTGAKGPLGNWALSGLGALVAGILIVVAVRSRHRRERRG